MSGRLVLASWSRCVTDFVTAVVVIAACSTSLLEAQPRELQKYHRPVLFGDQVLASYTLISVRDELSPYIQKFLYEDGQGRRVVIVWVVEENGPETITVKSVPTGETLRVVKDTDNSTTVTLGSSAPILVQFHEIENKDALPQARKSEGEQRLATVSEEFRHALKSLAAVGSHHSRQFDFVAAILGGLFFPEYEGKLPKNERHGPMSGAVRGFDPQVHPPSEFEQAFGDEYFQFP